MNVALIKTKAEQFLATELQAKLAELPGSRAKRVEAMERFGARGLPHRQVEAWKYTDLRNILKDAGPVAAAKVGGGVDRAGLDRVLGPFAALDAQRVVFIDGQLDSGLSELSGAFSVKPVQAALDAEGAVASALPDQEAIVDLNRALVSAGVDVSVAPGAQVARPLLIVNLATSHTGAFISIRHRLSVGSDAAATVIEWHGALSEEVRGQQTVVSDVVLGDRAALQHIQVGLEGRNRFSLVTTGCVLGAEAVYRCFQLSASAALARRQSFIRYDGEGARIDVSGLMLAHGSEHCDTTLVIDHAVPSCESREHFKAVLNDAARAVFQAKVIVRQDAQKTDGKQMANALMLSPAAEFDSKPELEIYADDVVCGHGATVAELDEDMLFYLRSRGIPEGTARALLIESFATEVLDKIEDEKLREPLRQVVLDWLATGVAGDAS